MNRINQKGMELIQYKKELSKDYPDLIKNSLVLALEQMVENKVLDLDTYMNIKDESFLDTDFGKYLLTKPSFTKTEEEIFKEFEVLRKILDGKLTEHHAEGLKTESIIDKDVILITRKFCINEAFTMSYFGVDEKDLLKLMKRRGFVEKFAVLRLTAIFKELMTKVTYPEELFTLDVSLVYFDKDENGYSIDLTFEVNIEDVESQKNLDAICEHINNIKKEAEDFYHTKTVF
ncbi:hypothetical protein CVD28_24920 [Bacillus sp. M6-12]|uniref:hypothetical protein n=1 Tax=Bacillus sp. M6-12 TaxID=2054166 RepID=UPI000C79148F|nr:hypothetical protein [Bacillus sp. M6-12]PLS15080.1 hypothetical protein CVD28_24920 [Bacillus sp. M6-12]